MAAAGPETPDAQRKRKRAQKEKDATLQAGKRRKATQGEGDETPNGTPDVKGTRTFLQDAATTSATTLKEAKLAHVSDPLAKDTTDEFSYAKAHKAERAKRRKEKRSEQLQPYDPSGQDAAAETSLDAKKAIPKARNRSKKARKLQQEQRESAPWRLTEARAGRLLRHDPIFSEDEQYVANRI